MIDPSQRRRTPRVLLTAVGLFLAAVFALLLMQRDPQPGLMAAWLYAILRDGLLVGGWWCGALFLGLCATSSLTMRSATRFVVALASGAALLILFNWWWAWSGLIGTAVTPFIQSALVISLVAYAVVLRARVMAGWRAAQVPWWLLATVPATALLALAATVAPGVLWSPTEFGGYDALSYHLQLPREWLAAGGMVETPHNAYGYLPNGLEAVFAFLMATRGGAVEAAIACQLMHAGFAVLAAAAVGAIVFEVGRCTVGAWAAAAIYLAMPWTIVTGTLAYNEQAMIALGAAGLLIVVAHEGRRVAVDAALIGLLLGVAILVKPTALGMFAAPVALLFVARVHRAGASWIALGVMTGAAALVLGGWLLRGVAWAGIMPPWITGWSDDQVMRWNAAHTPPGVAEWAGRLCEMALAHRQFGYVVFPAAIALGVWVYHRSSHRLHAAALGVLAAVQLAFWFGMTHQQSRFLLPLLVPACALIGLGIGAINRAGVRLVLAAALIGVPTILSIHQWSDQVDGQASALIDRAEGLAQVHPLNHVPTDARIYAEAFATPFYVDRSIDYRTVWNASPLGRSMHGANAEAGLRWLREKGYTHVAFDFDMLAIWTSDGNYGYDPRIEPERLGALQVLGLEPIVGGEPPRRGLVVSRVPQ